MERKKENEPSVEEIEAKLDLIPLYFEEIPVDRQNQDKMDNMEKHIERYNKKESLTTGAEYRLMLMKLARDNDSIDIKEVVQDILKETGCLNMDAFLHACSILYENFGLGKIRTNYSLSELFEYLPLEIDEIVLDETKREELKDFFSDLTTKTQLNSKYMTTYIIMQDLIDNGKTSTIFFANKTQKGWGHIDIKNFAKECREIADRFCIPEEKSFFERLVENNPWLKKL